MISLYLPSSSKIGSGYQAHAMANAFHRHGWAVTMHSPCSKPEDAEYDHKQIAVGSFARTFRFAWSLGRQDWSGFDVVHAHGDDYWMWFRKPAHVRTMHGSCFNEALHIQRAKEKLRMLMLGCSEVLATVAAHRTVAVSENTRKSYPWIREVIPNGVDLDRFHPAGKKETAPTILFVGTYRNRKRGELVMRAFADRILPVMPEARLWMVCGDAPGAPGVKVWGRVSEEVLADLYRKAWLFCLPSSYEGFGVPYIEAMASGTPVVATPNPGAAEILCGGKFGVLTEPEKLGEAMLSLLKDESLRTSLADTAKAHAQQYGWPAIVARYAEVYLRLGCHVEERSDEKSAIRLVQQR